jgi:hypothetical protein
MLDSIVCARRGSPAALSSRALVGWMDGLVLGLGRRGCVGLGRRWFVALDPWQGARLLGNMAVVLGDSGLGARLLGSREVLSMTVDRMRGFLEAGRFSSVRVGWHLVRTSEKPVDFEEM